MRLLLVGLVLWSAVGAVGTMVSLRRGDRRKAWRGAAWITGMWVLYLGALTLASLTQRERVVSLGEDQCFDRMCFAVMKVDEVRGFAGRGAQPVRVLRVEVRVSNRERTGMRSDDAISAYLTDAQGRVWNELHGLNGVPMSAKIPAGGEIRSEPVFRVATDATGLRLIFTHGRWQLRRLMIGDAESLGHRLSQVDLRR